VVVVTCDLVLEMTEESSLLLLLVACLINNPLLIFKKLTILHQGLMNMSVTMNSMLFSKDLMSGGMSTTMSMNSTIDVSTCSVNSCSMDISVTMSMTFTMCMCMTCTMCMCVSFSMCMYMSFSMCVCRTFCVYNGLFYYFGNNRLVVGLSDDCLFKDFMYLYI